MTPLDAKPGTTEPLDAKPSGRRWAKEVVLPAELDQVAAEAKRPANGHLAAPPAPAQARPSGEAGGHTVQDWEQQAPSLWTRRVSPAQTGTPREALPEAPALPPRTSLEALLDESSPPTIPVYLRAIELDLPGVLEEKPFDAKVQTLAAQSGALAEAISRGISQTLSDLLRPAIAAALADLLPMILSFGSIPDADPSPSKEASPVADRPDDESVGPKS